jgi:DNA-binding transcriptional ArsR family regulator
VWEALADPTRRAILERLSSGEARVTELAAPFDISLNSVSKHIRVLEKAKLVGRRRAGREHFICFHPSPLAHARAWIERQERFWKGQLEALDAFLDGEDGGNVAAPRRTEPKVRARVPKKRRTRKST